MKLAHVVKNLEEVDSKHHSLYTKKGEEFHLDDSLKKLTEDSKSIEDKVKSYEDVLKKALSEKKELEEKIKKLEEEKKPEVKEEKKEADDKKEVKKDKKETDPEIEARFKALEEEKQKLKLELEKINKSNEEKKFDDHLKALVEKENGNYKLLGHHLKQKIKKEIDSLSNEEVFSVLDDKGKTRFNGSERVSITELIQEFKKSDEFKPAFSQKVQGSESNSDSKKTDEPDEKSQYSKKADEIRNKWFKKDLAGPNEQELQTSINKAKAKLGIET